MKKYKTILHDFFLDFTWFNVVTNFKTLDGKVKKTLLGKQKQIKKGTKTVIVNSQEFLVNWDNFTE
jgi:hypothetical protein